MQPAWRPARPEDAAAIGALSRALVSAPPEADGVFEERIRLCPEGCFVLEASGGAEGYVISHPWRRFSAPKLDAPIGVLPAAPDCWLIHDLAVRPQARGGGHGAMVIEQIATRTRHRGLKILSLIAVGEAGAYWRRLGFVAAGGDRLAADLAAYGPGALYMERPA